MFTVTEMKLVGKAGLSGRFKVDDFLINRGVELQRGLSIRLDLGEIENDNPKFNIEVDKDTNTVRWSRKDQNSRSEEEIYVTAYFDLKVTWPPVLTPVS